MGILWLATEAKLSRNATVHKQVLGERHKATFVSTYQCVPKVRKFLGVRLSVTTHESVSDCYRQCERHGHDDDVDGVGGAVVVPAAAAVARRHGRHPATRQHRRQR